MRIDAHQHFWELGRFPYPWMPPDPSPLRATFLPEQLGEILARNRFDGCVTVQASTVDGEADWLLTLAKKHDFIKGVVAWVELAAANLPRRLDELQRHAKFKGVRHPVHDEPDHRWLLSGGVIEGLRELARRDLPYDLLLRPQHLFVVSELANRISKLRMVIDHIAKPPIASGKLEGWAKAMERIAAIPQVCVKLSGMITEADLLNWSADHLRPFVQHVLKLFGPDRLMFGSDWPACLEAGTWKEVLAAFTQAVGPLPLKDRSRILGETAVRFYRLG
jgi:L-fuconolactonase